MYPLLHNLRALQKHGALCVFPAACCAQTTCGYIAHNSAETQNGPSYAGSCTVTAIAKCCKQPCREKQRQSSPNKVHIFGEQVAKQPVTAGAQGSPQTIGVSKGGQGGYQNPSPFGVRLGQLKNIPMDYGSSPLLGMSGRVSRQRSGLSGVGLNQRYNGQDVSESHGDGTSYDDNQGLAQSPVKARKGSKGKLLNPAGGSKASWPSSYSQQAEPQLSYDGSMTVSQADQQYDKTGQSYEEVPMQTRLPLKSRKNKAQQRGNEDAGSEQDEEADQASEAALPLTQPPPPPPSRQRASQRNVDSSGGQQYQETDQPSAAGVLPPPHKKVQRRRAYMQGPDFT